ncbi:PadR family transcriptional regulator [uncultured Methanobrevibacter sp.]|uniref:PadR family transcriptional regulator n=1 Tax=uncultured Methanobrevibacter sp. TaxID=253161 RepID=UPI002624B01E|nr:PadR family transcriptional regulator [uncultured Methanobrevibacter sp.]
MDEKKLEPIMEEMFEENKNISKHVIIGLTRFIIIWRISKGKIHGYGLMKTIDEFFEEEIKFGIVNKANPSRIYPILKKLEKSEIIIGEWELQNNKNIKVYSITPKGELFLKTMKEKINILSKKSIWKELIEDLKN